MDTTVTSILSRTATARTSFASATYVIAEPTITLINSSPAFARSAAYVSMRVITVGGLTLLLLGLCCLAAVLLRFSQHGEYPPVHRVEREKPKVLSQDTINRSFPIRVYPFQEHIFLGEDEKPIASSTSSTNVHCEHGPLNFKQNVDQSTNKPTRQNNFHDDDEKLSIQLPAHHSFMGLGLVGRLWSRDSSRCNSACNSPCPSQIARMPAFTTTIMQQTSSISFTIPVHPESSACESTVEPIVSISEELCSVCLCEYVRGNRIRILPCSHEYHAECVDVWLTLKSTHCPLCKHDLLLDTVPATPTTPTTPIHIVEVPC